MMGHLLDQFPVLIGLRRRERDRRETAARLACEAFVAAETAVTLARRAMDSARRSSEAAQRARAQAPCDDLVADYLRCEHDRLEACKQEAALCAERLQEAQNALAAARMERQRAQVRLDVLENEHAAAQSRERRRGERKREEALPTYGALVSSC